VKPGAKLLPVETINTRLDLLLSAPRMSVVTVRQTIAQTA